ncbi:HepT-like ribonuclease domain-containing protein [Hydrogenimonas sp.]
MSERSDRAKIAFILEMVERIDIIVDRHGGVIEALEDCEGELALYMAISQIGEALRKLSDETVDRYALREERQYAYTTRNYIVHDYDGVDRYIIEEVIKTHLPLLKRKIAK